MRRQASGVRRQVGAVLILLFAAAIASANPPTPSPELIDAGKAAYKQTCLACHGANGDGKGPVAFAIKPPPRNFRKDPFKAGDTVEQIFATITNGLPDTKMAGYPQLPERDRWGLAYVVLAFRPAK